jgi:two-component system copper resistance phosphate regulon response regulator CusR
VGGGVVTLPLTRTHDGASVLPQGSPRGLRVLVVEDEPKVANAVCEGLHAEGYEVVQERTGEGGFFRASTEPFDIALLDLGLPGRSGLEVLAALREHAVSLPVLVITARDGVDDRVLGLDAGADDYLVKPFAFAELLARIRALLRRGSTEPVRLQSGEVCLDLLTRVAQRAGRPLELTVREFQLLEYLVRHQHEVVSRESLTRDVWQELSRTTPLDNVIDVHIARLRKKVDIEPAARLIHTIRGVGFMFGAREASGAEGPDGGHGG